MEKRCGKCKIEKDHSEFYELRRGGLKSMCKKCALDVSRAWRKNNPGKDAEATRRYYRKNREAILERLRLKRKDNPDMRRKSREVARAWRKNNPERHKENGRRYRKRRWIRMRDDPRFRLDNVMSAHIWRALRREKAGRHWQELVGYSTEDLKTHLEGLFEGWMTWKNWGEWEIDHIRPKSSFSYTTPEDPEFKECWALKNLRPLKKMVNRIKSNHYKKG